MKAALLLKQRPSFSTYHRRWGSLRKLKIWNGRAWRGLLKAPEKSSTEMILNKGLPAPTRPQGNADASCSPSRKVKYAPTPSAAVSASQASFPERSELMARHQNSFHFRLSYPDFLPAHFLLHYHCYCECKPVPDWNTLLPALTELATPLSLSFRAPTMWVPRP